MKKKSKFSFNNFNFINILGLTIGTFCFIAIVLWIKDEMGFDSFHKNADNIYRVIVEENEFEGYKNSAMTSRLLAETLNEKLPLIKYAANFEMDWEVVTNIENNYFRETGLAVVGKYFFDIFSFPFVSGNPDVLSEDKNAVVISENIANKYFGKADAVGKNFSIEGENVKVAGVFKNINYNSHIRFDIAIPEKLGNEIFHSNKSWNSQNLFTYVSIPDNLKFKDLSDAFYNFIPDYTNSKYKTHLLLQPLKDIHFQKALADEDYTYLGNKSYVYIFSFIGVFIIILACINYINLSTAVSDNTIKQNSMRKILGASRLNLIKNILLKSFSTSLLATLSAVILLVLTLPFINDLTQKDLHLNLLKPFNLLVILSIPILTGILSGIYPSMYIASFSPLNMVKKSKPKTMQWQRNALVIMQFSISIILITASLLSHKQLQYMRNMDTGFNKEQTMQFTLDINKSDYETLKENLLKIPGVEMIAGKGYFSSTVLNTTDVRWEGNDRGIVFSLNAVDENFFDLLNIEFVNGHNFSKDFKSELDNGIIINKKAKDLIGVENPIGMRLRTMGENYSIIGVIDNVHFRSINETIQPEFYRYTDHPYNFFVHLNNTSESNYKLIDEISTTIKELFPGKPIEFEFLDATYNRLYDNDKRVSSIFSIVAIIAILLSCMGLFGLSSYTIEKRVKEIGVRKVNGAKIINILLLLNTDFIKWVFVAITIAIPLSYNLLQKWLENFAYKTQLSWWMFIISGIMALCVAIFTVSGQSWISAGKNPVEALRYE